MTTCPETLLSGSLPTTLTETDGQKMIEKKERSAAAVAVAADSFAVPRFCPRLFCRTKWVCLSIPFRRQTRKKDGGGEEKRGETEAEVEAGPPWPWFADGQKGGKEVTCG